MRVIHIMPRFGLGGAEVMAGHLCGQLKGLGAEVSVISLYDYRSRITRQIEKSGIEIDYLHKKSGPDPFIIPRMVAAFKKRRPDIIHTHLYAMQYAMPAALLTGVRHKIHTVHSLAEKELPPSKQALQHFFYRFCGARPVAVSPRVRHSVAKRYRIAPKDIPVIPNGIGLDIHCAKKSYALGDTIKIIHIGRLEPAKNHSALLEAFEALIKKVPNAMLYLVGGGSLLSEIRRDIREKNLDNHVFLLGELDDVYTIMAKSDIFVLPSRWEGMPITLLEAMSCGMPIVTSVTGGVIADGKNGLLCLPKADSIEVALLKMIESEALRKKCGEQAQRDSRLYSSEVMARLYLAFYSDMLL